MPQFLDHQQFGDSSKKETGIKHGKSFVPEDIPQVGAVGKALQAFSYVAIDFMIAVQKRAPQAGPYLQTPIFHLLWDLSTRLGKIKKGRYAAGF
jgi:hypothetical protein